MTDISLDPIEKAAWEVYVELIGTDKSNGFNVLAVKAFNAVNCFYEHCERRREASKPEAQTDED
jgi:hypothetical protein